MARDPGEGGAGNAGGAGGAGAGDKPIENVPGPWTGPLRFLLVNVLLAALVVGTWWAWDITSRRRLDAAIAAAKARGEPILPEDFDQAPVPDERNAALLYRAAATGITIPSSAPLTSGELKAANAPALAQLRQAGQLHEVYWGAPFPSTPGSWEVHLGWCGNLAFLAAAMIRYEHQVGNDAEAVQLLVDMYRLAEAVDTRPGVRDHLLSCSTSSTASDRALDIAATLNVGDRGSEMVLVASRSARVPVSRSAVAALIAVMVGDDAVDDRRLEAALRAERATGPVYARVAATTNPLCRPLLFRDAVRCIDMGNGKTSVGGSGALIPPAGAPVGSPLADIDQIARPLAHLVDFAPRDDHMRMIALRRLAATALALRLYRLDHGDALPATLDELAPRYLPRQPIDPFSPDGHPLRLITRADVGPCLYSVGDDGKDDGGNPVPGGDAGWHSSGTSDLVAPLVRPRNVHAIPDLFGLPQTGDDQSREADEPGGNPDGVGQN